MKKLKANVCAVTHAGRIRRENEDNYSLNGRLTSTGDLRKGSAFVQNMAEPFHLSVCDGMGGENYGEIASGIANETIAAHASTVYESGEDFSFAISNCLDDANSRICAEINARGKRMGTTLAAMFAVKGQILCVNIGDTRIYHYSKGILEQISFDHTHAQTIVDAGQAQSDDIYRIPDAKRLTRHLGVFPEEANLSPNISVIDDIDDGDIILLCSDGLTDMLSDDDITAVLSDGESAQAVASKLVKTALERGGKDNITVITAFIGVEETAIFTPLAAAVVGDSDADYEDEYRNSYGSNQLPDEENVVSPYAKADARAYKQPIDKNKIMKIAGIVIGALAVVLLAVLIIKAAVGGGDVDETTTDSTTAPIYTYPVIQSTTSPWTTWTFESTTDEEETSTTEEDDTTSTTKKKTTTTRKQTTTKKTTTTTKKSEESKTTTTTKAETTTEEQGTTANQETTTESESTSAADNQTSTTEQSETSAAEQQVSESETSAA